MADEKNVKMKATRSFSGSQTGASYLGRIEIDEEFEAHADDAAYLARNGYAQKLEEKTESSDSSTSDEVAKPEPQTIAGAGGIEPPSEKGE